MADLTKATERRDALKAKLADLDLQVADRPAVFAVLTDRQQQERDAANAETRRLADEADACRSDLATAEALLAAAQSTAVENVVLKAENVKLQLRVNVLEAAVAAVPVVEQPVVVAKP